MSVEVTEITPVIRESLRRDGSLVFIGYLEEYPGVMVQEDSRSAALAALRNELTYVAQSQGLRHAFLKTQPEDWEYIQSAEFTDLQPGCFVWTTREFRAAAPPTTIRDPQPDLWEHALQVQ